MTKKKPTQPNTIRKIFFTGLAVVTPTSLTLFLIYWLITMGDQMAQWVLSNFVPDAKVPMGIGIFATALIIFGVGLFVSNYLGRKIYELYEKIFKKIPVANHIFGILKKVIDMVLSPDGAAFKKAVLVEFPRKECWMIGFLSAEGSIEILEKTKENVFAVFIPTTPNPTSGVLAYFPLKDIKILDMTVEEAGKLIISGGILTPEVAKKL
ncbi:MAG: hypothetical protein COB02_13445 [Candidatus Cloacimonadota bacterium]|nr:MAG: hypothetical protein COB02_13445 [Candidatus Cloacimonadota bacterium]